MSRNRNTSYILIVAILLLTAVLVMYQGSSPQASSDALEPTVTREHEQEQGASEEQSLYYSELEAQLLAGWHDDLFLQPRILAYARAASAYGFEPATTPWRTSATQPSTAGLAGFSSPGALLSAFAAEQVESGLGTEILEAVSRLHLDGDSAIGALLLWGYKDDAIAGRDYKLTMNRNEEGWYTVSLEERFHCRRGVAESGLCT